MMKVRVSNDDDTTEGREEFGRLSFRVMVRCPECNASCEVEARGWRATRLASQIGHAFMEKHDHRPRPTAKWSLP